MLPAVARLRSRDGFADAFRRGRRAHRGPLVLHLATGGHPTDRSVGSQVGFVISRKVGDAVRRNTLRRRLRHILRARLGTLPDDATLVVRALPGAAELSFDDLAALVDDGLATLVQR